MRGRKLAAFLVRLWERHDKECDKALKALDSGDNLGFEFYKASANAILRTIRDLTKEIQNGKS